MAENEAPKGTKYVTVACKVPNGLRLPLCKPHTEVQADRNGNTRDVVVYRRIGEIRVNGPRPLAAQPNYDMPGGYALTHNVLADDWQSWFEANKESDMVKKKMIFATSSPEATTRQAREQEEIKSNLEPLDVSTIMKGKEEVHVDPRWPKALPTGPGGSGVSEISTGARA